jgi:hypothetical protein
MSRMKIKIVSLTLALGLCAAGSCFADAFDGTWKLNMKKSDVGRGMTKNSTVTYSHVFPFRNKVTIDGTDGHGKPFHAEWTGRYDGSDYETTGDPVSDTRAVKEVNDHTLNFWSKKGGKVVNSGTVTVSPDGKTRTVVLTGTNAKGKKTRSRLVYDKA